MRRWICLFMVCLFGVFIGPVMAFGQETPVYGGTLIWARTGDNVRLDLAQTSEQNSLNTAIQCTETLITNDPNSMELKPCLATSWEVAEDRVTWTLKLRKGVKFHDGTDFTAQAVKDSLERISNKEHPFHGYGKWSWARYYVKIIKEIRVIDDHTVAIVTKEPYPALPIYLAKPLLPILSPKAMAELKDQIHLKPVGTGPFKFVRWDRDDQTIVERNDEWWGPKPYLDKIVMKVMPEPSARRMALQSGVVDMADALDPDSLNLLKKDPNLTVLMRDGVGISYVALNCERPNLDNAIVRRAINHAIDKDMIVKVIYLGMANRINSCMALCNWGYNYDIKEYEYNPAKAKELLKKAGLPNGFDVDFMVMPISRAYMPEPSKATELIQAYLAAVGIRAKLVRYEWGTFLKKLKGGDFDLTLLGNMSGSGDPDTAMNTIMTSKGPGNRARWKNAEFDELVFKARNIFDRAERTKLYLKAQDVFYKDIPWVPLANTRVQRCYNKRLHNVPLRPTSFNSFEGVWKKK
jgi:peptide/nickel transport system substrate-binding protein